MCTNYLIVLFWKHQIFFLRVSVKLSNLVFMEFIGFYTLPPEGRKELYIFSLLSCFTISIYHHFYTRSIWTFTIKFTNHTLGVTKYSNLDHNYNSDSCGYRKNTGVQKRICRNFAGFTGFCRGVAPLALTSLKVCFMDISDFYHQVGFYTFRLII